jgi:hypothetical protein
MIDKFVASSEWTSANPTHINTFIQANAIDSPDFEAEINRLIKEGGGKGSKGDKTRGEEKAKVDSKKLDTIKVQQDQLLSGNIGKLQKFTTQQFGTIRSISTNPIGFIFGKIGTKLVRGGVILGLVLLVEQIMQFALAEMMKPGRILDRRLKILIEEQQLTFTRRSELANLRQGFRTVFVTASPFIRGQKGTIGTNLMFQHNTGSKPYESKPQVITTEGRQTSNTNRPGGSRR